MRLAVWVLFLVLCMAGSAFANPVESPVPASLPEDSASAQRAGPAAEPDALAQALRRGDISRPRYALARADSLFRLRQVRSRYGAVHSPDPKDATRILQQLELRRDELTGRRGRRAASMLARPTDGVDDQFEDGYTVPSQNTCIDMPVPAGGTRQVCVHWVASTPDAPPLADVAPLNGMPDQVDRTLETLEYVWDREVVQMGYRAPEADAGPARGQGPNSGIDVYMADVGDDLLFGYCAADPQRTREGRKPKPRLRAPAYCVIDNDFSPAQFEAPSPNGLPALQVTVAHEFFHAIQFAYEYSAGESWLKEGTAAWIEDEVFDAVDANRLYLDDSVLLSPETPLDYAGLASDAQDFEYGAWVFWRFLSESLGPDTIRLVWEATAPTSTNDPSALKALNAVVSGRASTPGCVLCNPGKFRDAFAEFAIWNLLYDDPFFYEEGPAWFDHLHRQHPPYDGLYLMDSEYSFTSPQSVDLAGLSQGHVTFRVHPDLVADTALNVFLNNSTFKGGLEVTALVEFLGEPGLSAYRLEADDAIGFAQAESVVLLYSNAAAAPDDGSVKYSAELVPDP